MTKPTSIDEHLASLDGRAASRLRELRALIHEAAPEVTEALTWGNPAFLHPSGMILVIVGTYAAHANLAVTPSTREAFAAELTEFGTGKGTVKLPDDQPVPADLLRRMVAYRLAEYEQRGVTWM